jgi:hypothetical protein
MQKYTGWVFFLSVYAAAQAEHKEYFLLELVRAYTSRGDLPFSVGEILILLGIHLKKTIQDIMISGYFCSMLLLKH